MQYKWVALTVTTVGTFMSGVDGRIVIIGLPVIASQLHIGAQELIWISQSYLLASTIGLLFIGRITDLFGRVKVYNVGFVIFTVGSALSALSSNSYELIGFRALQGIGSGILVTNSAAIVTDSSPPGELGTMLGINGAGYRIGGMAGLTLSGLILSIVDWRGLFYVNVPVGIFGTIWAQKRLKEIAEKDTSKKMDWWGLGIFSFGLTFVLLAITYLSYGTSGEPLGLVFMVSGLILIAVFAKVETRTKFPMLDLSLFKSRLFAMGNIAQLVVATIWSSILVLLALFLEIGLGYPPLNAGIAIIPTEVALLIVSITSGKLSDKYGSRLLCPTGLAVMSFGLFEMSTFGASTSLDTIIATSIVLSIGSGLFNSPNFRAIMSSVPANRRGIASGVRNTMFQMGLTASYGLTILFFTFGIPYNTLSQLLQGTVAQSSAALARSEFFDGFRITCILMAIIVAVTIIPSLMRGQKETLSPSIEPQFDA